MDPIDKLIIVRGVALVISVNFYLHSRDMSSSFSSATAQTPSDKLIASGITFLMDTSTQNVRSNPTLPSLNNSMDPGGVHRTHCPSASTTRIFFSGKGKEMVNLSSERPKRYFLNLNSSTGTRANILSSSH